MSGAAPMPPGLDDASRALLAILAEHNPATGMGVDAIRARAAALARRVQGEPPPLADVSDHAIAGPGGPTLRVPLYRPDGSAGRGALVWLHGGGFTTGDLDTRDALCRRLSATSRVPLLSVDYRLAPEHRWPAAVDDATTLLRWLAANAARLEIDAARLGIGGSTAGGNLAAAAALRARDDGGLRLALQVLVYPVLDATASLPSYLTCGDGYQLTAAMMRTYLDHYIAPGTDPREPLLSPLHAPSLSGLPPACVVVAELDPLRDEVDAYVARLRQAGVAVEARRWDGVMHGFFGQAGVLEKAREAQRFACAAVARALGDGTIAD
ncbi:MAG: alpha/beta hydrolase [Burkholderiales bacterium]